MALSLALSYAERNDNKALTISDVTSDYGVGENIGVTDVTEAILSISVTTSNNITVDYTPLDLVELFGSGDIPAFLTQADMIYTIDATMLKVDDVAIGTADDELPDGIWEFTYVINTTAATLQQYVLLDGRVKTATYELLRCLPNIYNCKDCKSKKVLDTMYIYTCLNIMRSDAYIGKTQEILNLLYTIERMITNGSHYTW